MLVDFMFSENMEDFYANVDANTGFLLLQRSGNTGCDLHDGGHHGQIPHLTVWGGPCQSLLQQRVSDKGHLGDTSMSCSRTTNLIQR